MSPQLYLKRPYKENEDKRLDRVLKTIADRGVKVYIIVYREISGTLNVNSEYVKSWLNDMSPNIITIRHPRYYVHFWSHHEKMCLIDSKILFMGGLDLCYGRYEHHNYPLSDKIG